METTASCTEGPRQDQGDGHLPGHLVNCEEQQRTSASAILRKTQDGPRGQSQQTPPRPHRSPRHPHPTSLAL